MIDIKAKAEELLKKIKGDDKLLEKFQSSPVKTVEGLLGVDLPDDQVQGIVEYIKAKLGSGELLGKIGGLFGKK